MSFTPSRIRLILFFMLGFQCLIVARLFYLQIIKHDFYTQRVAQQLTRVIPLPANRGAIRDRHGRTLVTDIDSYNLYCHPKQVEVVPPELASLIGITPETLARLTRSAAPFVWIRRHLSSVSKERIDQLKLPGFGFIPENHRFFVNGAFASHVLGFVGTDQQGLGGIEFSLNQYLAGQNGKLVMESDPYGRQIASGLRLAQKPQHGSNVYLTLDANLQQALEEALAKGKERTAAKRAMGVVMDSSSGEVLAMAGLPDFNPNEFWKVDTSTLKNPLVSDVFEPGSTFKVVGITAGINEGQLRKDSVFFCPNHYQVGNRTIGEAHDHPEGNMTVSDILRESLNVGMAQIGLKLGARVMEKYIYALGFGQTTGIELPGESRGIVRPARNWSLPDKAIIPFGQGIAVTPLQLISAYSTFANRGKLVKPKIVKKIERWDGTVIKMASPEVIPVIQVTAAEDVKQMLIDVVARGTGGSAKIPGFSAAGKTGTAQKVAPGARGYFPGHYVVSFIGFVPALEPRVLMLMVLDDPEREKWGGSGTGPIFADMTRACIKFLNIEPDEVSGSVLYTENNQIRSFPALRRSGHKTIVPGV